MVIPSLMYKILRKDDPVVVWGDGSAIRDFAFSRDVAQGIVLTLYHGTGSSPYLNLGGGGGHSIRQLVDALHSFLDFYSVFDASKPSGLPKRVMDISLAKETIGYNPATPLRHGLKATWDWFVEHQDEYLKKQNYFL
jgi:GDP-L-fucose synthase